MGNASTDPAARSQRTPGSRRGWGRAACVGLVVLGLTFARAGWAQRSYDDLDDAVRDFTRTLVERGELHALFSAADLAGKRVLVKSDDFFETETGFRLPLSKVLSDKCATELTRSRVPVALEGSDEDAVRVLHGRWKRVPGGRLDLRLFVAEPVQGRGEPVALVSVEGRVPVQGIGHDPLVSVATSSRTPPRADPSESSDIRAVILVYHHVDTTTPASTSVTPERFAGHLDLLAAGGYRVVPLADVVEALRFGKALPDRAVVLTFDDAFRSVYTEVFPLLRHRDWPFTVFVNTDAVDGRHGNTMNWNQLREIEAGGGTVGNHSRTHDHLVRRRDGETREQWRRRVGDDILWARRRLEAELAAPLEVFAYPYGEFTAELEALVREIGLAAVGQQSGPVGADTDPVRIPRFPVATGYDDRASLAQKLRTRALRVEVVAPRGRVLPARGGPPTLTLRVLSRGFALDSLTCFATGQGRAGVVRLDRQRREVQVRATAPLPAGRSKYTCTAPVAGRPGAYFWFSHPWLKPRADGSWPGG